MLSPARPGPVPSLLAGPPGSCSVFEQRLLQCLVLATFLEPASSFSFSKQHPFSRGLRPSSLGSLLPARAPPTPAGSSPLLGWAPGLGGSSPGSHVLTTSSLCAPCLGQGTLPALMSHVRLQFPFLPWSCLTRPLGAVSNPSLCWSNCCVSAFLARLKLMKMGLRFPHQENYRFGSSEIKSNCADPPKASRGRKGQPSTPAVPEWTCPVGTVITVTLHKLLPPPGARCHRGQVAVLGREGPTTQV